MSPLGLNRLSTRFIKAPIRKYAVQKAVNHIKGPIQVVCKRDEFVVLSFMRNAELHLEHFVEHHLDLGAKQIFLLDNGSIDESLALAKKYSEVTLLQCLLPYKYFKYEFRRFLLRRCAKNCWGLLVDIDERFCHPFSDRIGMSRFLQYLNRHNYTAVMGQMLDLFPAGPATSWPGNGKELVQQSCWYELESLQRFNLERDRQGKLADKRLFRMCGGIRVSGFKMDNHPNLTKYPLLFSDGTVQPNEGSSHRIRGGRIADTTCLLKHYKFHRDFEAECRLIVEEKSYYKDSLEYRQYLKALKAKGGLVLKTGGSRRFSHVNQLIDENFLVVSEAFRQYVNENAYWKKTG